MDLQSYSIRIRRLRKDEDAQRVKYLFLTELEHIIGVGGRVAIADVARKFGMCKEKLRKIVRGDPNICKLIHEYHRMTYRKTAGRRRT